MKKSITLLCLTSMVALYVGCGKEESQSEVNFYKSKETQRILLAGKVNSGYCVGVYDKKTKDTEMITSSPVSVEMLRRGLRVKKYWSHVGWTVVGELAGYTTVSVLSGGTVPLAATSMKVAMAASGTVVNTIDSISNGEDLESSIATSFDFYLLGLVSERILRGIRKDNLISKNVFNISERRFDKAVNNISQLPTLHGSCENLEFNI